MNLVAVMLPVTDKLPIPLILTLPTVLEIVLPLIVMLPIVRPLDQVTTPVGPTYLAPLTKTLLPVMPVAIDAGKLEPIKFNIPD